MVPILFISFLVLDLFIFSICFEASLIPLFYLMIRYSGGRARRLNAALLLIIYTIGGSLLMLLGIGILYIEAGTTYLIALLTLPLAPSYQIALFSAFFIAFSIKIPIVPFHLWLPEAHVEAPTSGSMLLASLFLKLGQYGIIRFAMPLFIESFLSFLPFIITIALIGLLYGLVALRQVDLKKIIAYSSIAHLNTALLGLKLVILSSRKTNNLLALSGSIHIALAHGLLSGGLFYSIGLLNDRYHSRLLRYYRGLFSHMPLYSILFFFFILANLSFPLFTPFLAELAIIIAYPSLLLVLIISLNGSYSIWLYNRLFFGTTSPYLTSFNEIYRFEFYTLFLLLFALFSLWTPLLSFYPLLAPTFMRAPLIGSYSLLSLTYSGSL
jgi:NADH-ubiquinone oxidoreductase chain 4